MRALYKRCQQPYGYGSRIVHQWQTSALCFVNGVQIPHESQYCLHQLHCESEIQCNSLQWGHLEILYTGCCGLG